MKNTRNMPKKEGFYWATVGNRREINAIIRIYGVWPYLSCDGWVVGTKRCGPILAEEVFAWGDKIKVMKETT